MARRIFIVVGASVAAALAAWLTLGQDRPRTGGPIRAGAHVGFVRAAAQRPPRPARPGGASYARGLSLAQLAGQRVIYAYSGLRPPPSLLSVIRAGEAGGVILFGNNISSRAQIAGVLGQLQRAATASPVRRPLLVLTDQEGGEVRRLSGAPIQSEKEIGLAPNGLSLARAAGAGAGRNLAVVRINTNLAPVLDIYRQPGNFIDQFQRSYSNNSARVAGLGAAFISAQQPTGVAATAKHFPGLGAAATSQNTDLRPVTLNLSLRTLHSVDEAPYGAAIRAGVKLVMTSWAIYPALDRNRPAGLSPTVIGHELRGRLGFRGVTITDGIDAGAVTPFGNLGRRGVLAAAAGADLILCAATNPSLNTPQEGITVLHALTAALSDHQLGLASTEQSVGRILALRR